MNLNEIWSTAHSRLETLFDNITIVKGRPEFIPATTPFIMTFFEPTNVDLFENGYIKSITGQLHLFIGCSSADNVDASIIATQIAVKCISELCKVLPVIDTTLNFDGNYNDITIMCATLTLIVNG